MIFLYGAFLWLLLPLVGYWFKRMPKQGFSQNLRWVVLALIIVALARPVLPEVLGRQKINAHSLVVALDLSVSMNADDIKPNRAKASRQSIEMFLKRNHQEQIALVGFTSNPLLLSPPTTDHELLLMALESLNGEYILTKGTNLKKLFEKVAQFQEQEKRLILFTDGGDERLDEELISFVQRENIKLFVIGMATQEGSGVKDKEGRLLTDEKGRIVVSKLNGSLEQLAYESGGEFVAFSEVEETVSHLEEWLAGEKILNNDLMKKNKSYFELAFVPLLLAIVLLLFSATRFSKKLLVLLAFLGLNLHAETLLTKEQWGEGGENKDVKAQSSHSNSEGLFDAYYLHKAYDAYEDKAFKESKLTLHKVTKRTLESELLLAHIFYQEGNYQKAKSILQGMKSSKRAIKQQILYELGNCEAQMAYWQKAKSYYVQALQLGEDEDVLHNLKVVSTQLKEHVSKVGYSNPASAKKSSNRSGSEKLEERKEKVSSKKGDALGSSGGTGSKKSKNSTVKVVKTDENGDSKRTLSSKAYDLINEGYISEEKPW